VVCCHRHYQFAKWEFHLNAFNDRNKSNSGLTNRLITRVTSYYLSQIRQPTSTGASKARRRSPSRARRTWAEEEYHDPRDEREEAVSWLAKVLESVRVRYRKIQRYARHVLSPRSAVPRLTTIVLSLCVGHCNYDSQIVRSTA
jgi:hypothetical protein